MHISLTLMSGAVGAQVQAALYDGGLEWSLETTRQKLLPLLLEWDLTHASAAQVGPLSSGRLKRRCMC